MRGLITWRIPAIKVHFPTAVTEAIMGLTRTHATQFGGVCIRVNSIMSGSVATRRQIDEAVLANERVQGRESWPAV
ncbi:hypothetical protein E4U21_002344 [Claviceps maximensis]|nr:hypothetical protein E4U21_002344 [Claviceps maximensis]